MTYCQRCVYPQISVNLNIDDQGICSSCRTFEKFNELTPEFWYKRKKKFEQLLDEIITKSNSEYDCLIPVRQLLSDAYDS